MSKKTLTWLLIISLIINISTIASFSYYQWFKPDEKKQTIYSRKHKESLHKKLGFTDEQSEKMRELRKNLFAEIKPLKNEINQKRGELLDIVTQDSISLAEINQKIDEISEIETKIHKKAISNLLKYRLILTVEQRDKFLKMVTGRMFDSDFGKPRHSRPYKNKSNSDKK